MTILSATSAGSLVGYFDIPANVPAGAKPVVFSGSSNRAETEYVGRGTILLTEMRRVISVSVVHARWRQPGDITSQTYRDPVAQTVTLEDDTVSVGIDVQFSAKGATNIIAELRETSLGVPNEVVLASTMLTPGDVTDLDPGDWTRFSWAPVSLQGDREYAVVLLCDDADWEVRIATLGQIDLSVPQLVSEQPYMVGVLLKSSNNTAWTVDQASDLTFRLLKPVYTVTSQMTMIGSASATSCDMVMVQAIVDRPTNSTDLKFQVVTSVSSYTTYENFPVILPAKYTGSLTVWASMTGTEHASPYLHRDIQILCGEGLTTGSYTTIAVPCASSGGTCRATMNMSAYLSGGSSITVTAQNGVAGETPLWSSDFDLSRDDDLGEGWYDRAYTVSGLTATTTRFKIVIDSTPQTPAFCRNLQAYCVETT